MWFLHFLSSLHLFWLALIHCEASFWGDEPHFSNLIIEVFWCNIKLTFFLLISPIQAITSSRGEAGYLERTGLICVCVIMGTNGVVCRFLEQYLFFPLHSNIYFRTTPLIFIYFTSIEYQTKAQWKSNLYKGMCVSWHGALTARGRVTRTCGKPCPLVLAKQMLIHGLSGHVRRGGRLVELADFVPLSSCSPVILLPSL